MTDYTEMKVTYIDPDRRALYVGELPDGGWGVWTQKDKAAPRKLTAPTYIKPEGYATPDEAQKALGLYVDNKREGGSWARWDVFVNGKAATFDELHAMVRGELPAPQAMPPAAMVTLANIEYRIATHIQGAYENILQVGACLNEAKEAGLVPHGEWEAWVRRNTNMSERQAQKLMQAARAVSPGSAMERLPISKIQAILALPEPEREPMAEKAAAEDMSLRELQEAVRREKNRADQLANINEKTNARAAKAQHEAAQAKALVDSLQKSEELARATQSKLLDELEKARKAAKAAPAVGISSEAQAEIDRLKAELADAEAYAEQQAVQRQQAQRDMLALQSQAARGETQTAPEGLTAFDLAAAVRAFIGVAGVLPHMGTRLASISEAERQEYRQYIGMVEAWTESAKRAMNTIAVAYDG